MNLARALTYISLILCKNFYTEACLIYKNNLLITHNRFEVSQTTSSAIVSLLKYWIIKIQNCVLKSKSTCQEKIGFLFC